jgi:hypothetical protein
MAITGPKVEGWREQVEATALLCSTENHDDFIPGTAVFNSRRFEDSTGPYRV